MIDFDAPPLLIVLCEAPLESLCGRVVLHLDHIKAMLGVLTDPDQLDNTNGDGAAVDAPSPSAPGRC